MLSNRVQASFKTNNSQPTSTERRLIQVMDTCNSSKITFASVNNFHKELENVWDADPEAFNNVTSDECLTGDCQVQLRVKETKAVDDLLAPIAAELGIHPPQHPLSQDSPVQHVNVT